MSRVFEALCAHLKTHPEAEVQDAVKFLYQASFGGGHFLSDPDGAYLYLLKEAEIANLDAPYTEALGGICMKGIHRSGVPAAWKEDAAECENPEQ